MISELIKYGALSTKARAMYGKRLKNDDYERLSKMSSVAEIADHLKRSASWRDSLSDINVSDLHRSELESALRRSIQNEFRRLFMFAPQKNSDVLTLPVYKTEYQALVFCLHRFGTPGIDKSPPYANEFIRKHSKLDFVLLSSAESLADILRAAKDTIYYDPLLKIARSSETSHISGAETDILLQGAYYAKAFSIIAKTDSKSLKRILYEGFGADADLMNIIHVMRLLRFGKPGTDSLLFPVFFKLKPEFFKKLLSCSGTEQGYELLRSSPYTKLFRDHNFTYIDEYYSQKLYEFNKKQLLSPVPSIYIPIAYMAVRTKDLDDLIHIVECVRYGAGFDKFMPELSELRS